MFLRHCLSLAWYFISWPARESQGSSRLDSLSPGAHAMMLGFSHRFWGLNSKTMFVCEDIDACFLEKCGVGWGMHASVCGCVNQYLHKQRLEKPKPGAVRNDLSLPWKPLASTHSQKTRPPQHLILPYCFHETQGTSLLEETQCLEFVLPQC